MPLFLETHQSCVCILLTYRQPTSDFTAYFDNLTDFINENLSRNFIVLDDFNARTGEADELMDRTDNDRFLPKSKRVNFYLTANEAGLALISFCKSHNL